MENKWAIEHLQSIRTLMERSALYRRALAPIMLLSGILGITATVVAQILALETVRGFAILWTCVGLISFSAALLMVRRQALNDAEPFWSLPTQRVASGLFPCFFTGLAIGIVAILQPELIHSWLLASLWILNYGCALRAAGFFMQRGIQLFGTIFLGGGAIVLIGGLYCPWSNNPDAGSYLMGACFGVLHLGYGAYLYFTERRRSA